MTSTRRHNIAVVLTKFYLRSGRGHALIDFLITMVKNIVYLGILAVLFQKWFGFTPPSWVCILIGVSFEGACYLLGLLDERVGFWKFSNVYSATELSPFSNEMMERIKDIQKCQSTK